MDKILYIIGIILLIFSVIRLVYINAFLAISRYVLPKEKNFAYYWKYNLYKRIPLMGKGGYIYSTGKYLIFRESRTLLPPEKFEIEISKITECSTLRNIFNLKILRILSDGREYLLYLRNPENLRDICV